MLFKVLVVSLLIFIVYTLFSGLFFLLKDQGHSDRTVKSLTIRIVVSLILFALLMVGAATGLIHPHGVGG